MIVGKGSGASFQDSRAAAFCHRITPMKRSFDRVRFPYV